MVSDGNKGLRQIRQFCAGAGEDGESTSAFTRESNDA